MPYGELDLIREIRRKSLRNSEFVRFGVGDDAAVLRPRKGEDLVVTTDFSLEDVHFADFHPPFAAGYRCLARGLSDVAAMGGRPLAAFLSLALSPAWARNCTKTREFLRGLHAIADQFNVVLAGGDTAGAPGKHTLADIIVVGAVPRGRALLRSGARPGDAIYITGRLGGAAAEFDALRADPEAFRRVKPDETHPHLFPQPRITVGHRLLKLASACMDVSDGLSTDLHHLCEASGVGASLHADLIPLAPHSTLDQALHGGEDYELLFTSRRPVPRKIDGVEVTKIGTVTEGKRVSLVQNGSERRLRRGGWQHLVPIDR